MNNYGKEKINTGRCVPINLRQSGDCDSKMLISTRVRKSPYYHLSQEEGCWCHTVYNRIYHPRAYIPLEKGGLLEEYKYLTEHVSMWNVAVERQIQVKGPDAAKFVDQVITRSVDKVKTGSCRYVILCNKEGGILNDPVLLRLAEDEFWFSLSDSDIAFWLQGVNTFGKFNVEIKEIDVCPVQIQGPKSTALMTKIFGSMIEQMPYYGLTKGKIDGCDCTITRTGFSAEVGYEIYLHDATTHADTMWKAVKKAGEEFNLKVIAPGHIRRIEAGILSWGQDIDNENNPYECGLGWQVDLNKSSFIGKDALAKIKAAGVKKKLVGLIMGGEKMVWYNSDFYIVQDTSGNDVGYVSSSFWSPTQNSNIALAMVEIESSEIGSELKVVLPEGIVEARVEKTPFRTPYSPGTGLLSTGAKL